MNSLKKFTICGFEFRKISAYEHGYPLKAPLDSPYIGVAIHALLLTRHLSSVRPDHPG